MQLFVPGCSTLHLGGLLKFGAWPDCAEYFVVGDGSILQIDGVAGFMGGIIFFLLVLSFAGHVCSVNTKNTPLISVFLPFLLSYGFNTPCTLLNKHTKYAAPDITGSAALGVFL